MFICSITSYVSYEVSRKTSYSTVCDCLSRYKHKYKKIIKLVTEPRTSGLRIISRCPSYGPAFSKLRIRPRLLVCFKSNVRIHLIRQANSAIQLQCGCPLSRILSNPDLVEKMFYTIIQTHHLWPIRIVVHKAQARGSASQIECTSLANLRMQKPSLTIITSTHLLHDNVDQLMMLRATTSGINS